MEEGNQSQKQEKHTSSDSPSSDIESVHADDNLVSNTAAMSLSCESQTEMAVLSFPNQEQQVQHHQQQQPFYPYYPENIQEDSLLRQFFHQWELWNQPQFYPSLPGHLEHQQEQFHQYQMQQQQQQLSPPLHTNYFSTPRDECTIHVAAGKSPTENMNLARKFLVQHETVYLCAFDAAIVIAIDAALLIQRSKYATIVRVETDTENRVELQPPSNNYGSPSFASIMKRPQIRITLQRSEEFVQWLEENKNHPTMDESS